MRALLDTQVFLWWGADDPRLSAKVRNILSDDENELLFSVASGWEIVIKAALGKLDNIPKDLKGFIDEQVADNAFRILPVHLHHALGVYSLPQFQEHKDPFDRLLIAQALAEGIPVLSGDSKFASYPVNVVW